MKQQKTPVILSRSEIESMIEVIQKEREEAKNNLRCKKREKSSFLSYAKNKIFLAIRNEAIIRLAFSTGLRVKELTNLNDNDIFLEESRIKVRAGKRGNDDYQPVTKKETLKSLRDYWKKRKSFHYNKEGAFFIGKNGSRIQVREIQRMVKEYAGKAGITKNVYPHILRHSFLTHVFDSTGDIRKTQIAARHKSITSTLIYEHTGKENLAKALREADL